MRYLQRKNSLDSRTYLETVFMSRLIVWGLIPDAHVLVKRIIHHGFHDGHMVADLEGVFGKSRRLIYKDLAKYDLAGPVRWLAVCRIIYVVYIHFRLRGSFEEARRHLGLGSRNDLSEICRRVSGVRPGQAHRECRAQNSILPFMDRCMPYLGVTNG